MIAELGLALPVETLGLRAAVELGVAAERLGFGSVWSSEVAAADAFIPLAAIARETERVRLGVAVVPAGTRPAALLAMQAAALAALSDGRFVLGVGASSRTIVESWMDSGPYLPAQTRVRETIEVLRRILTGERTSFRGETVSVDGFSLEAPPAWVPLLVGALRPGSYRLAGEIADGVVATLVAPEGLAALVPELERGAREAGRDPAELEVACRIVVALDEDSAELRRALRRMLGAYSSVPAYAASFTAQGFAEEVDAIRAAWRDRDREAAVAQVSERMLTRLTVLGPEEACVARLREYAAAGVATPIVVPVTAKPEPQRAVEAAVERLASLLVEAP